MCTDYPRFTIQNAETDHFSMYQHIFSCSNGIFPFLLSCHAGTAHDIRYHSKLLTFPIHEPSIFKMNPSIAYLHYLSSPSLASNLV